MEEFLAELERNCDDEVLEEWEKNWLPRHKKRPKPKPKKLKVARCLNLTELREQGVLDGMTDEEAIEKWDDTWPYPVEQENSNDEEEEDVDISEIMEKSSAEIRKDLLRLRDFTLDKKEVSPALAKFLKPGQIISFQNVYNQRFLQLFSLAKTEHMSEWYDCREYRDGKGTVALLRRTKSSEFIFIPEDPEKVYRFTLPLIEKTFVYRAGATVLLCSNEVNLVTIRFKTKEEALQFELDFMLVAEFDTHQLVRLYGEFPEQQLKIKDYIGSAEYKPTQEFVINKIMEEKETFPFSINRSPSSLVDNISVRIKEYSEYCKLLQIRLFQEHSLIHISEEMCEFVTEVQKDLDCLLTLIPFCSPSWDPDAQSLPDMAQDMLQLLDNLKCCLTPSWDPDAQSLPDMAQDMLQLLDNLKCCLTLKKCSEIHEKYIPSISMILENVREILSNEDLSLDFDTLEDLNFSREMDELKQLSLTAKQPKPSNSPFNIISQMCDYLEHHQKSPNFPKTFDDLDKVLRVGDVCIFDVLYNNLRNELVETTLDLKTAISINKEVFGDRSISVRLTFTSIDMKNVVSLAELSQREEIRSYSDQNAISAGERISVKKQSLCMAMLQDYVNFTEKSIGFNHKQWQKLRAIRDKLVPSHVDWRERIEDAAPVTDTASNDSTTDSFDSYEKVDYIPCPPSWHSYRKFVANEFQHVREVGSGAYGVATLLLHKKLWRVVYKEYDHQTSDDDVKREIDMMINILLKYNDTIQVCDFGTCIDALKTRKTFMRGTIVYMSPEMINKEGHDNYDEKTDVFSLGVVMWELIHRMKLYPGKTMNQVIDFISAGERLAMNGDFCPHDLQEVICSAWADLPTDRPSMKELEVSFSRLLTQFSEADIGKELTGPPRKNKTEEYEEDDMTSE